MSIENLDGFYYQLIMITSFESYTLSFDNVYQKIRRKRIL